MNPCLTLLDDLSFQNHISPSRKMSSRRMKVSKCPSDTLTMTNRAIVNPRDFDKQVSVVLLTEHRHASVTSVMSTHRREDRAWTALRLHHRDGRERQLWHCGLLSTPEEVGHSLPQSGEAGNWILKNSTNLLFYWEN